MADKIPWYLKDPPRDPYARARRQLSRLLDRLTSAQLEDWLAWTKGREWTPAAELDALRHFEKVRNS